MTFVELRSVLGCAWIEIYAYNYVDGDRFVYFHGRNNDMPTSTCDYLYHKRVALIHSANTGDIMIRIE